MSIPPRAATEPVLKVLITGASGLVGAALARALVARGHHVIAAARDPGRVPGAERMAILGADLANVPGAPWWAGQLAGVDVVVNAVGIFREQGRQSFEALHTRAPVALFEGALQAGVPRIVQLSALGSDPGAVTPYHRSKHAADQALRALPICALIVQPSLVYAPAGPSARLFQQLAALPALVLPRSAARLQPVHLDDLVEAVVRWICGPAAGSATVAAVGPQPMTLARYLAALRSAMGFRRPAVVLRIPPGLAMAAAGALGSLPGSIVDADAVRMLLRGNEADVAAFTALLGHPPRPVAAFVAPADRPAAASSAWLHTLLPLARLSVALVWIWTGLLSLGLYPTADSLQLLADFGLHGTPALAALYAGALVDLVLGVLTLAAPRRHMGWVWCAQLVVITGYTAMITLRMPHWWLHPYGPLSKNLPMLALIGMLWALQRRS